MDNNIDNFAVAGLVLGIVSIVFSFIYIWIGLASGIVGIVLSTKGLNSTTKKNMATAGLVCSIIGTSLSGLFLCCAICAVGTYHSILK